MISTPLTGSMCAFCVCACKKFLILHGGIERRAQCRNPVGRHFWRQRERTAHDLLGERNLEQLFVGGRRLDLDGGRHAGKRRVTLHAHQHDDLIVALRDPWQHARAERRRRAAGNVGVDFIALERQKAGLRARIAADRLELGAERDIEEAPNTTVVGELWQSN